MSTKVNIKEWCKGIALLIMVTTICTVNVILAKDIIKSWIKESVEEREKIMYPDWTDEEREAAKRLHKYHGTCYSFQGKDGKWYFFRGNELCELWDPKEKKQ